MGTQVIQYNNKCLEAIENNDFQKVITYTMNYDLLTYDT